MMNEKEKKFHPSTISRSYGAGGVKIMNKKMEALGVL